MRFDKFADQKTFKVEGVANNTPFAETVEADKKSDVKSLIKKLYQGKTIKINTIMSL